ncbi:MAG: 16S rRNA (cytosine(1402)-N(4))-methyltransferase RsmH [Candidatus Pacebacteria bacterium]|nr:16S rRNA (cytosine(1402)-N(4))-methyltransferase RsmH [Candidatus Paceibacterota bacterium]
MKSETGSIHKTVLLHETIDGLRLRDGAIVVDGTFGGGGHSELVLSKFPKAKVIAFDQDESAWEKAKAKFATDTNVTFVNQNFRNIGQVLKDMQIEKVDGVVLDLGLSSDQLDNSGRGFSFMKNEPLLMTMKANLLLEDVTAMDIVNTWGEESIANIIYGYGEEKQSRRIAKAIVDARQKGDIKTTFDLVKIIEDAIPAKFRKGKIHFATKTFQALRIAVNDELGALSEGLQSGFDALKKGGRMSVISFHSLEDRVVKKFYKEKEKDESGVLIPARLFNHSGGNKKVITASIEEIKNNSRSRSAKLRIIQKE